MRELSPTTRFRKEFKLAHKRGKKIDKLNAVIDAIAENGTAPSSCKPHILSGDWAGVWECHIEPDWLLIYEVSNEKVFLLRTGTHSDLFKK